MPPLVYLLLVCPPNGYTHPRGPWKGPWIRHTTPRRDLEPVLVDSWICNIPLPMIRITDTCENITLQYNTRILNLVYVTSSLFPIHIFRIRVVSHFIYLVYSHFMAGFLGIFVEHVPPLPDSAVCLWLIHR